MYGGGGFGARLDVAAPPPSASGEHYDEHDDDERWGGGAAPSSSSAPPPTHYNLGVAECKLQPAEKRSGGGGRQQGCDLAEQLGLLNCLDHFRPLAPPVGGLVNFELPLGRMTKS